MIRKLLFALCLCPVLTTAQISFTSGNSALVNASLYSGVAIGVTDMNGDGLDDIIRLNGSSSLEIEYQNTNGVFTRFEYGSTSGSKWGMAIADVDRNGYNDILAGGSYNGLRLFTANSNGTNYSSTNLTNNIFVQNLNFADIDNNGTIDIFACHDVGLSKAFSNDGTGAMTENLGLINTSSTIPSDNSGNYGSVWIDYDNDGDLDLYIAKCRLGVNNENDGRRVNLLFENDGNNNYTEVGPARGLVPLSQSWSAAFEDIDNDGDLDCVLINHDDTSMIFENNGFGVYTNITAASGIATSLANLGSGGIQVIIEDFDNDTYVDIFITTRSGIHKLYKNDGDKTFTELANPFPLPFGASRIQSAAVGDLNNDGFVDVMAGFASGYNGPSSSRPDRLYFNSGNATNNWSEILLEGTTSNINGIGARIEIYGAWGKQIREVRSGESYGIMNSLKTHFGLGTATAITKIVVKWPSGNVDEVLNPSINQSLSIIEGSTLSTTNPDTISKLRIYPNPTSNVITVEASNKASKVSYNLYDVSGKLLKANQSLPLNNQMSLQTLAAGVYMLQVTIDGETSMRKIIKQ